MAMPYVSEVNYLLVQLATYGGIVELLKVSEVVERCWWLERRQRGQDQEQEQEQV